MEEYIKVKSVSLNYLGFIFENSNDIYSTKPIDFKKYKNIKKIKKKSKLKTKKMWWYIKLGKSERKRLIFGDVYSDYDEYELLDIKYIEKNEMRKMKLNRILI